MPRISRRAAHLSGMFLAAFMSAGAGSAAAHGHAHPTPGEQPKRPLTFEMSRSRADQTTFVAVGEEYTALLTSSDVILALGDGGARRNVVRLRVVGGNAAAPIVAEPQGSTYGRVRYVGVYPGIDLVFYGSAHRLEYDFVVAPGADPRQIELSFDGIERPEVDAAGDLVAHAAGGELRQPRPVVYQEVAGARAPVRGDYVVDDAGRVRFRLGAYDASRPLVIDPVLAYATYLGGTDDESSTYFSGIVGIAVDGAGNRYVTGTTRSADFPTTAGADRTLDGDLDVFVTKLSPTGAVLYSTYLGGPCDDTVRDIAVDAAGNAYITGRAHGGTCQEAVNAGVLVAKLDAAGGVIYAVTFGGSLADTSIGQAIAVDAEGHAYVTGAADTSTHDFPTTPGAFRTEDCANVWYAAGADGFVAKLSADGSTLLFSTFLCGTAHDSLNDIAVDAAGNVYVAGSTESDDFPTAMPMQAARRGGPASVTGVVSKLTPDGSGLVFSTYLGGSTNDAINGIAVDRQGNVYVTGETQSGDFPTTPGVLQEHSGNPLCFYTLCSDAFVTKIDAGGSALVYSTFLFGEGNDSASRIALDDAGNAYLVGTTSSLYFPIVGAFQANSLGSSDAYVAKLNPDGTRLLYSSYLGGSHAGSSPLIGADVGSGIAVDATGQAHVAGYTLSFDFPTTPGAVQTRIGDGTCDVTGTPCGDAFVVEVTAGGPGVTPPISLSATPADVATGGTLTATWAGLPAPTASDQLRLYTLGSLGGDFAEVASWPTGSTADGRLSLTLPGGLARGWYELRLLTPDPESRLLSAIARSEPIRVGDAILPPDGGRCDAVGVSACDDGDPCTVDECVPGQGCVSTPAVGFAGVACTCHRASPAACAGQRLPPALGRRLQRVCGRLDVASTPSRKRLKQGVATLDGSIGAVARFRKKGKISEDCAGALQAHLRDAKERTARFLTTLGGGRR